MKAILCRLFGHDERLRIVPVPFTLDGTTYVARSLKRTCQRCGQEQPMTTPLRACGGE